MNTNVSNINTGSTSNVVFPETIIGIGGAGKKLVFSLLSKRWILEEILRPKGNVSANYRAITVDTAVSEDARDSDICDGILEKIATIQKGLRKETGKIPNNLSINCQLLTKGISTMGEPDIMGKTVVDNIKIKTGTKYWWFYPQDIGDNVAAKLKSKESFTNLNFASGVIRRRALGKAILYKAISEKRTDIALTRGGKVAMIVGLGGGTGSGAFIDYAKKLKEKSPNINIILFAVLPTSQERDKEQTNGFTSLCELEYMKITGEFNKIFECVVLLPMEPTMYRDDNDMVKSLMEEFHDAFAYTFASYFTIEGNIPYQGYSYAPFIIASSCIVRYNIESNRKIIDHLNSALTSKIEALQIEKDINIMVDDFLKNNNEKDNKEGNNNQEYILEHEDNQWLSTKLTDIKKLLFTNASDNKKLESFTRAGYQCFQTFGEAITRGEDQVKSDDIFKKIPRIQIEIGNAKKRIQNPRAEIDTPMINIISTEPSVMYDTAKLFYDINNIKDDKAKKILNEIMKKEGPYSEDKLWINNTTKDLSSKSYQIKEGIEQVNKGFESYKEDTADKVTEIKKRIISDTKSDIERLQKIENKEYKEEIKIKFERLNGELLNYVNDINKRGIAQLDTLNINNLKRTLEDFVDNVKYIDNTFNMNDMLNSIDNIKNYRIASLIVKGGIPLTDKFLRVLGFETGTVERIKRAEEDKRMFAIKIRDGNVFEIKKDEIKKEKEKDDVTIAFKYSLDNILNRRVEIIIENIILKLNSAIKISLNSELNKDQEDIIKNTIKINNFDSGLEDIIKNILKYNVQISEFENKINKNKIELESTEKKNKFLIALGKLYDAIYDNIYEYRKKDSLYKSNMEEFGKFFVESNIRSKFDDRYVFQIEPQKESNIIGRDDINTFLIAEKGEEEDLLSKASTIIENKLFSRNYNSIANQYIELGADRWSVQSVALCTSCLKSIPINKQIEMSHLFRITDSRNIGNMTLTIGDTWDLGLTLFVAGIFLDNIVDIADPTKGYYASYTKIKNEMKELIFLHHAYLLEKGRFVNRTLIPLEDEDNKKLFASNDEDKIIKKIKECQNVVPYASQLINNNIADNKDTNKEVKEDNKDTNSKDTNKEIKEDNKDTNTNKEVKEDIAKDIAI